MPPADHDLRTVARAFLLVVLRTGTLSFIGGLPGPEARERVGSAQHLPSPSDAIEERLPFRAVALCAPFDIIEKFLDALCDGPRLDNRQ